VSDDKKPTPQARLASVKFDSAQTLLGVNAIAAIHLDTPEFQRWEVSVVGASVFVRAPGGRMFDVPRSKCVLSYVTEGMTFDEAVKNLTGKR
jgi:hypothetical protein